MSHSPLTHFNASGDVHMVDVTEKSVTSRSALAEGMVLMSPETLALVRSGTAAKGDVLGTARLAAIMGAKRTSDLIPLCHPLPLSSLSVDFEIRDAGIYITAHVRTTGRTGVEMEALTAVSVAALTLYDMLKAAQKSMEIQGIRLLTKEGGKSGRYEAEPK